MRIDTDKIAIKVAEHMIYTYSHEIEEAKDSGGIARDAIEHIIRRNVNEFFRKEITEIAKKTKILINMRT